MKLTFVSPVFVFLVFVLTQETHQVSLEEDLSLTYSQKLVLDKFKERVGPVLPHDYMKRDIYLIRWLRAKNFALNDAENMLMENLRWRKEMKMDTVVDEDWSDYEKRFPYYLEGCDKEGRPVSSVSVGDWDVRGAVLAGQRDKIIRYMDKLIEQANILVRVGQDKGKNITQYSIIFDLGNYNLVQQGCSACIPVYLSMFNSYENHYPGAVHRLYLINTPPIFQALLSLIRPLLSPFTRDSMVIYGHDKSEWQAALLNDIEKDHMSRSYGGTKESGYEPEEVRKMGSAPC